MPEQKSQFGAWLAQWLDEETRERWFAPAYYELLEDHLQQHSSRPKPLRFVAGVRFQLHVFLLVVECMRLRASTPRPIRTDRKGDKTMTLIWQDVKYAARGLAKSPAFTLVAVLTLALGIGANTAIFSVVDTVLLRPLAFPNPEQLVTLWEVNRAEGNALWRVAPANYVDWRAQADAFSDVALFGGYAATLTGDGDPVQVRGGSVSANFFPTLGVQPLIGRAFQPSDEDASPPVILLGYGFWQSRFGGSESVIGRALTLDGNLYTVIGVMPDGIYPTWVVNGPRISFLREYQDLWRIYPKEFLAYRGSHVCGVLGRMKPGVTVEQAQKQMDVIAARLEQAYPVNKDEGAAVRPIMVDVAGTVRPALLLLLAAVGAVLLVACLNVAGLLLARLTARRHEIAVRCALGVSRAALVRQFLAEGALLALLGGTAGVALAVWGQGLLLPLIPLDIPRLDQAGLDLRVLAFTSGLALLSAIAFAMAPAWSAGRVNIADAMKELSRGGESARPQKLRRVLVVAQVSLAVVLTIAAGLLAQSFSRMGQVHPGFRTENLLIAEVGLSATKYTQWQQVVALYRQMLESARNAPGVTSAHLAYDHPLDSNWLTGFDIEGRLGEKTDSVQLKMVTPGYFAGMGQRLLQGREFDEQEDPSRPGVAIINEAFVRRYFPDGNALGKVILSDAASYAWRGQIPTRFEIVGVVNDVHSPGLESKVDPFFYVSVWQSPVREMTMLVRTANDPLSSSAMLRQLAAQADPDLPLAQITTMEDVVSAAVAQPRLNTVLMSIFSGLGLLLALVGVYGLIAFWVAARTREIGVRLALGASPADVLRLVMGKGLVLVVSGAAVGVAGAVAAARFLQSQLYGISALDLATLVVIPSAIVAIALLACLIPAWRATRVDPLVALRSE